MESDSKLFSFTTKNLKISRRGFLEKCLIGMMLASAVSLGTFASMAEVQAGTDEFSSQDKPKVPKAKSGKKGAAKPAGGAAKPAGEAVRPAGGYTRPETPGY